MHVFLLLYNIQGGMDMKTVIIACKTMEKELLAAMSRIPCSYEVRWLEAGMHNQPKKLNEQLQALLDACSEFDTVLLCMSLCGNAVAGLQTHDFQLIIPRCDDCISLMLGGSARRKAIPATYFFTEGWLKSDQSLWSEYQNCLQKYGKSRTDRIFSDMLSHYRHLALLDTGCYDTVKAEQELRKIAETFSLEYVQIEGTLDYIRRLLTGDWDTTDFIIVPKHSTLTLAMCSLKGAEIHA